MKVGVGGGIGPVRGGISNRGAGLGLGPFSVGSSAGSGGTGILGMLVAVALIALALLVLLTAVPVVIAAGAVWVWRKGMRAIAGVLAVVSVIAGLWLWPMEYGWFKYNEPVPSVSGSLFDDEAEARRTLHEAGFANIETERSGTGDTCWVRKQSPEARTTADTREPVTLYLDCGD